MLNFLNEDDVWAPLGKVRTFEKGTAGQDLIDTVGEHRAALLELKRVGDVSLEKIERMADQTQGKLAQAKREAGVEWVPGGDARALDARYLSENGVHFKSRTETFTMPDEKGNLVEEREVRHGLLTDPHTVTPEHERLRRAYNAYALAARLARGRPGSTVNDHRRALRKNAFLVFREAARAMPGQVGDFLRRTFNDPELFKRVIGNAAGAGGELIAVPTIEDVRRPFDLARRLAGLIPERTAKASAFKRPVRYGRALARRRGGTSNDPARYPVQTWSTTDDTVTLVETVINVLLDDTYLDEASQVMEDPLGEIIEWIASGRADTKELAILHGDTAATHQDTIATWRMGAYYAAGDLDGTTSPLRLWIGLRAGAFDDSNTVAGGGAFTAATHWGAIEKLGNLGSGAVAVLGLATFYLQILANALFTTVDKFGAAATLVTGTMGKIGDTDLVISEFLKNEFASTGLYTGSGSTGTMVYFQPRAYRHYMAHGTNTEWDVTYPEQGAQYVGNKEKCLLVRECLSTEKPAAAIINL